VDCSEGTLGYIPPTYTNCHPNYNTAFTNSKNWPHAKGTYTPWRWSRQLTVWCIILRSIFSGTEILSFILICCFIVVVIVIIIIIMNLFIIFTLQCHADDDLHSTYVADSISKMKKNEQCPCPMTISGTVATKLKCSELHQPISYNSNNNGKFIHGAAASNKQMCLE